MMTQKDKSENAVASLHLWARDLRDCKPEGVMKTSSEIFDIIREYTPGIGYNVHWRDSKFEVLPFSWWEKVLEHPFWTAEHILYIPEKADCEAFSLFFLCLCELFLKTNGTLSTGGICKWTTSKGGDSSSHRFNFIIANENNVSELYIYEPMYNRWKKIDKGSNTITIEKVFGLYSMDYTPTMINN